MFEALFEKSGLSLERLRSFCRVAEVESFTRAAAGDPNRQTLYSRQVKELEAYFSTLLFKRNGRTITLTETGRHLFQLAMEYFAALEDFTESCSGAMKSYTIGAGESLIRWLLLPKLLAIRQITGRAEIVFNNRTTNEIVEGVKKGSIDFGLIRAEALIPELSACKIQMLDYALFTSRESMRGLKPNSSCLSELTFVGMAGGGLYHRQLEALAHDSKTLIRYALRCNNYPNMVKVVQEHGYAAILPTLASQELPPDRFTSIQLQALKSFNRQLVLCWNTRLAKINPELKRIGSAWAQVLIEK